MGITVIRVQATDGMIQSLHDRGAALHKDPEVIAARVLQEALRQFPIEGRTVVLGPADLEALGQILQGGDVLNGADLVQKVGRLASIKFAGIRMEFTPGQLEEIGYRAARLSLTPEELVRRTVKKMEELFFTHLGVGSQV